MLFQSKKTYGKIWAKKSDTVYREFTSSEQCKEWGRLHYGSWGEGYKETIRRLSILERERSQISALEYYCGYSHSKMNEYLYNGKDSDPYCTYEKLSEMLMYIICSAPLLPEPIVVYRLAREEFIEALISNNKTERPTIEKAFLSTSLCKNALFSCHDEHYSHRKDLLQISVNQGVCGIYVNEVTPRKEEEFLMMPNACIWLTETPYYDPIHDVTVYPCSMQYF